MPQLTEADVLRIMREEWDKKIEGLREDAVALFGKVDGDEESLLSPELKIKHVKSGIRYTVDSVGPRSVVARTPEDDSIVIDKKTLETEYELA